MRACVSLASSKYFGGMAHWFFFLVAWLIGSFFCSTYSIRWNSLNVQYLQTPSKYTKEQENMRLQSISMKLQNCVNVYCMQILFLISMIAFYQYLIGNSISH